MSLHDIPKELIARSTIPSFREFLAKSVNSPEAYLNPLQALKHTHDYGHLISEFEAIANLEELQIERYGPSFASDRPLEPLVNLCALLVLDSSCLDDNRGKLCTRALMFLDKRYPLVMEYVRGKLDNVSGENKK